MNILDGNCEQCGTIIRFLSGNPRKCLECQGVKQNPLTKIIDAEYVTDQDPLAYLNPSEIGWLDRIRDRIIKEEMEESDI